VSYDVSSPGALLLAAVITASCAQAPAAAAGPRLYILDCGDIKPMDPNLFGLKKEEIAGDASFVTPCYLVVHPKGTLIWDVGQVPDAQIPDDGSEVVVQDILKARHKLVPQLQKLGHFARRHHLPGHVALPPRPHRQRQPVRGVDLDRAAGRVRRHVSAPRNSPSVTARATTSSRTPGASCSTTRTTTCSVTARWIIKTAPGPHARSPDAVPAAEEFRPLLLEGDLYHLPEERTLDRVPTFDFDAAMTRASRVKTEAFLKETGAQMWIQHDPPTNAKLRKAPAFYD
jgi:hypothetical protein